MPQVAFLSGYEGSVWALTPTGCCLLLPLRLQMLLRSTAVPADTPAWVLLLLLLQIYSFGGVSCVVDNAQNLVRAQLGERWQTVSLEELFDEQQRRRDKAGRR